jgi:hypothetical protein
MQNLLVFFRKMIEETREEEEKEKKLISIVVILPLSGNNPLPWSASLLLRNSCIIKSMSNTSRILSCSLYL